MKLMMQLGKRAWFRLDSCLFLTFSNFHPYTPHFKWCSNLYYFSSQSNFRPSVEWKEFQIAWCTLHYYIYTLHRKLALINFHKSKSRVNGITCSVIPGQICVKCLFLSWKAFKIFFRWVFLVNLMEIGMIN